jgi:hypothetical protein
MKQLNSKKGKEFGNYQARPLLIESQSRSHCGAQSSAELGLLICACSPLLTGSQEPGGYALWGILV